VTRSEDAAAIAAFITSKGITRCPTVCLLPTQGSVSAADRAALRRRARALDERRRIRAQREWQLLRGAALPESSGEVR
jgi:hypothetical protein